MKYAKLLSVVFIIISNLNAQPDESKIDSISYYMPKIMVTANRYEKNVFETNMPVNMVQAQKIWQHGTDNFGEMLQQNAGVDFTSVGPWSQKLIVRGLAGPQVLTLIDGMRLDVLRSYGNHAPLIDVDQIERVEIIRGPASILYGSDAIAGVINFITKQSAATRADHLIKGKIGFQYSSVNQQYNETIKLTSGYRNLLFRVGFIHRKAEDINTPKGKLTNTGFNGYTIDAKIDYKPSDRHHINLSAATNRMQDVGVPINEYAKNAEFLKYNRDLITLSYNYNAPRSIFSNCRANIYYQTGERNFDAFIYQKPNGLLFVNQTLNAHRDINSYGANIQNSLLIFKKNLLTSGIEMFSNTDDTRRFADAEIYNSTGEVIKNPPADTRPPTPESNRRGIAFFVEDEFTPWSKWIFTMGIRFDYITSSANATAGTLVEQDRKETDSNTSGNLGLLYRLTKNIHLMANVGRAFKAPTLQERYFKGVAQVGYLYGNPELNSELSLNLDAGIKWEFCNVTGEFNLFRNRINEFIVMKPISVKADTFVYENVGQAELYGGEFQANIKLTNQISIFMNAAYVHGQDVNMDEALPKIPPVNGLLRFRYETLNNSYWLEFTGRFVNSQHRVLENELETPGYNIYNFSSGINLDQYLRLHFPLCLTFNVKNIFNKSYRNHLSSVTWWDAAGRNIIVGLRSNF